MTAVTYTARKEMARNVKWGRNDVAAAACWLRKQIDDAIRANSKLYLGLCASSLGGCFLMNDILGDQFDLALALAMRSCVLSMM